MIHVKMINSSCFCAVLQNSIKPIGIEKYNVNNPMENMEVNVSPTKWAAVRKVAIENHVLFGLSDLQFYIFIPVKVL